MPQLDPNLPIATARPTPAPSGDPPPKKPDGTAPAPAPLPRPRISDTLDLSLDAKELLADPPYRKKRHTDLSPGEEVPFDQQEFDRVWTTQFLPQLTRWPNRDTMPFAIQSVRYADKFAGGRETHLVFERDPRNLLPPTNFFMPPTRDPRTGDTNLELRQALVRLSAGEYDLILEIDQNGQVSFDKLFISGKSVSKVAGEYLKGKIKENPMVWGSAAVAGGVAVVALAHNQAAKTGKPIEFDAYRFTLLKRENFEVKAKLRGELTGDSRFVRGSGAEIGTTYVDGRMSLAAGARYYHRTENVQLAASMGYQVDKQSSLSVGASYDRATNNKSIGLMYQASF